MAGDMVMHLVLPSVHLAYSHFPNVLLTPFCTELPRRKTKKWGRVDPHNPH
jgi:hypothetical protein